MGLKMVFLFFVILPFFAATSGITDRCLNCICKAVSGCRTAYMIIDAPTVGYYQLTDSYWHDCGKPGAYLISCARDKVCADTCVKAYMRRYARHCTHGVTPTCEDFARIHIGGPHGCRKTNTIHFWKHVQAYGCTRFS